VTLAQIVDALVRVGRQSGLDVHSAPAELDSLRGEDAINRLHWREWDAVTGTMVIEDLVALAKALTVCEERFRWTGGSVAAVIWVYREIEHRDRPLARQVADWILARTSNPWAPFGTMNLGARSIDQYDERAAARGASPSSFPSSTPFTQIWAQDPSRRLRWYPYIGPSESRMAGAV
jgi:hypothetical protein